MFGRREKVGERWLWPVGFAPRGKITSVSVVAPTRLCLGRKGKEEKIKLTTSKREIRPEVKWKLENSKIGNNKCANV